MSPSTVVASQLNALQLNDWPENDAGACVAFSFTKPQACETLAPGEVSVEPGSLIATRHTSCTSSRGLVQRAAGTPARSGCRCTASLTVYTCHRTRSCFAATAGRCASTELADAWLPLNAERSL